MEFYYFLYLAFLLFCFILSKTTKKFGQNSQYSNHDELPPGPPQIPILGNAHQLSGGHTHHILRDLAKKYGPLMHLKIGEVSTIVASSPQIAEEIFRTHDILFADRPSNLESFKIVSYDFSDMVVSPYGNYWRQLRKISMMELLSQKSVQSFRSIREEEVLNFIKSIGSKEGTRINLSKEISLLIYGITTRAAFGEKNKNTEEFIRLLDQLTKAVAEPNIADMFPSLKFLQLISTSKYKIEKIHKQFDVIVETILKGHKEKINKPLSQENGEKKEDLVDVLLNIQRRNDFEAPLGDKNIKAIIFNIFSAGTETSSTTVDWAMCEMIKNPTVMKKAQEEVRKVFNEEGNVDETKLHQLKYLQAVIKETLRLHPPVPLLLPRECREQCKIKGYTIPSKSRVIVNAWAIGRDPNYWIEPEKFNPDRFLESKVDFKGNSFEYLPFGGGRRICPGITFALANIELPLAQLLFHFDWQSNTEKLNMKESRGVTVRREDDLYLTPVNFSSSSPA
ncbi:hypothetical protein M9H77_20131 [Catharanthus roseus]|uniref:Tabersonine 16-hydroxylase 1 n=3 Tax=Catharanthus roseus TaxID=4058 RepID=C71DC_CATRO|nr:RecName: Full=Tabersonine 16-hydroxylase 1; AltName: Full=Cytochrome P450 71D12 [Catharanthus roseus]ACM92061.1 tabersonine 16-hydroxylase CYP71D12 [Catharanthus roseus]ADZ48683.1 tabersonine 16-hydroxylase [synthetic construct]KAI5660808.1 hypothetical protein M9H77_20131 [Catharanthus roseus]